MVALFRFVSLGGLSWVIALAWPAWAAQVDRATYQGGSGADSIPAIGWAPGRVCWCSNRIGPTLTADVLLQCADETLSTSLWAVYFGASGSDYCRGLVMLPSGDLVAGGLTYSTTVHTIGPANSGGGDGWLARYSSAGSLQWSRYVGGTGFDQVMAVSTDPLLDQVYAAVTTSSSSIAGWPATAGYAYNAANDVAVVKASGAGTPAWVTWLGGSGNDYATSIDVIGGAPVVGGITTGGVQGAPGGYWGTYWGGTTDGFVTRVANDGSSAMATAYVGSALADEVRGVALLPDGSVTAVGVLGEAHPDWVAASLPGAMPCAGLKEGFAVHLGSGLNTSFGRTCIGGSGDDAANAVRLVASGVVVVAGQTTSADFRRNFSYSDAFGTTDAFAVQLGVSTSTTRRGVYYSTMLGGSVSDYSVAVTSDSAGNAYVAGTTSGTIVIPSLSPLPLQFAYGGGATDGFVSRVDPQ
jgi:hypothetical protein